MSTPIAFLSHNNHRHHERGDAPGTGMLISSLAPSSAFRSATAAAALSASRNHNKQAASKVLGFSFQSQHAQQSELVRTLQLQPQPRTQPQIIAPSQATTHSYHLALLQAQRVLTHFLQRQQHFSSQRAPVSQPPPHATMHGAAQNPVDTPMDLAPWLLDACDQQQPLNFASHQQAWQSMSRKPSFSDNNALPNNFFQDILGAASNGSGHCSDGSILSAPSSSTDGVYLPNWESAIQEDRQAQQSGPAAQQTSHSCASSPSSATSLASRQAHMTGWADLLSSNQNQDALLSSVLGGLTSPLEVQQQTQQQTQQGPIRYSEPQTSMQPQCGQQATQARHTCQPGCGVAPAPANTQPEMWQQALSSGPASISYGTGGSPYSDGSSGVASDTPQVTNLAPTTTRTDGPRDSTAPAAPVADTLDLPDFGPDGLFLGDDSAFDLDVLACLDYGNDSLPQRSATQALDDLQASLNDSASTDDLASPTPDFERTTGRHGRDLSSNPRVRRTAQASRKRRRRRRLTETKKRELRNDQLRLLNIRNAQLKLTLHNLRREANQFEDLAYTVFLKYGRVPGASTEQQ